MENKNITKENPLIYVTTCWYCGCNFKSNNKRQKYCDSNCRSERNNAVKRMNRKLGIKRKPTKVPVWEVGESNGLTPGMGIKFNTDVKHAANMQKVTKRSRNKKADSNMVTVCKTNNFKVLITKDQHIKNLEEEVKSLNYRLGNAVGRSNLYEGRAKFFGALSFVTGSMSAILIALYIVFGR